MIKNIQSSPMKLEILECWEKEAFVNFRDARDKLVHCREVWLDYEDQEQIWYVDIGQGHLTWTSYNLILQFCREEKKIIICADLANLRYNTT